MAKAKQLVQQSGTAGQAVTVWSSTRETHQKAAEYLTDILNQLGYKAKLRAIDPAIYWATIGNQKTKAQTGLANWFQDYPHPLNWFDTLLNGNRITEEHNNNYSNADVAAINNKIEELKKEPSSPTRSTRSGPRSTRWSGERVVGAVREPAVHGLLHGRHGSRQLLREPRPVPVRLHPGLQEGLARAERRKESGGAAGYPRRLR